MGGWLKSARRRREVRSITRFSFDALESRRLLSALPFTSQQVNFTVGPIVADPTRDLVYVADQSGSKVLGVDTLSGVTASMASTITAPTAMAVSSDGSSLLVFEGQFNYVEVLSLPSLARKSYHAINYTFTSIAQSRLGQIYGATSNGIVELSNLYAYVQTLGTNGQSEYQPELKLSADGNTLYALDTNTGGSNTIDSYDVSTATPVLKSQVSIDTAYGLDYSVSASSGQIFSAADFTDGVTTTNIANGKTSTYAFTNGFTNQYSAAVAALPGSPTVFAASADAPAEIEEFNAATGAVVNDYEIPSGVQPRSLVITPNGHLMYVGTDGTLGLIGNSQMNVLSTGNGLGFDNGTFIAVGLVTEISPSADATTGVIGTIVYDDINNDGALDAGDISTTVTQSDGDYGFPSLPGNTATLRLILPNGYVSAYGYPAVLSANSGESGNDFSVYKTNTVSGLIFNDTNGNGRRDATESGLANIRVYADLNYNGVYDAGEPSTLTDSTGYYDLAGLYPPTQSSISIDVVQPNGQLAEGTSYVDSESGLSTTFTTGLASGSYVAGEVSRSLGSAGSMQAGAGQVVYLDYNNDGVLDNGEPSTVSDGYGNYSIGNLASGSVTVRVQPLTGFTIAAGQTSTVTLNVTSNTRYSANFFVTAANSSTIGGIAGQVYNDANGNGSFDPAELPLQGRTVYIDSNDNGVLDSGEPTAVTDSSGNYFFSGLTAVTYEVRLYLPSGLTATAGSQSVTLNSGVNGLYTYAGVNFGSPAYTGTVTGEVYNDVNDNGTLDTGETGLYGRTVYVDANNNGVLDLGELSTTTDGNGKYTLSGVPAGTAIIRQVLPSGSTGSPAYYSVGVPYNQTLTSQNFGSYAPMAGIYGLVFDDVNGNGTQDAGDQSIVGRTVYLDLNNDGIFDSGDLSTVTNANGYGFSNLAAGTYTVRQVLPTGWQQTTATVANSIANGATARILLGANQPVPTANAGGPYVVGEAGGIGLSAGASTDTGNGHIVLYEWDLNYNGTTFNPTTTGVTTTFMATGLDGPSTRTVALRVTDNAGNTSIATAVVNITDVPPTAVFSGSTVTVGSTGTVTFSSQYDPSPADVAAGFKYDYDFNNDGTFELTNQSSPTATVPASYLGAVGVHTIRGRIIDKDGGFSDYTATITVTAATGASIAGTVTGGPSVETIYLDANNNGLLDTNERSTTTTANGAYSFSAVAAGAYVIRQQLPVTYLQTSPAGNAGIAVTVSSTSTVAGENFMDKPVPVASTVSGVVTGGAVGETIYLDTNDNSKLDAGELSTTTSASGTYTISNVPSGATIIRQVLPTGYTQTTPSGGLGIHVTVTASSTLTNENFTDKSTVTTGSISGNIIGGPAGEVVYLDANNNDLLDSGELSTTVTAAPAGYNFSFASVPAGSYVLRQVLPAGYSQTSPTGNAGIAVTVSAGSSLTGKNFADTTTPAGGNISGTVTGSVAGEVIYLDANNNSKLDTGELSTTTSATGSYSFSNVPVGATIIRQILPTGYTQTSPSGGLGIHVTVTQGGSFTKENFTDKSPAVMHTKLTGTTIGTAGSYNNSGNTIAKATDGSTSTFFDGQASSGNWVGLDLGSAKSISQIAYAPRSGYGSRMTGGQIQISTTADFSSGVTTIYTITGTPPSGLTTVTLSSPVTARYVRYLSPAGSHGDISEFEVFS